jgi:hypothetical protein
MEQASKSTGTCSSISRKSISREQSPRLTEVSLLRMTIIKKNRELVSSHWVKRSFRASRPPPEFACREAFLTEPEACSVINEQFDGSSGLITE